MVFANLTGSRTQFVEGRTSNSCMSRLLAEGSLLYSPLVPLGDGELNAVEAVTACFDPLEGGQQPFDPS